MDPQDYPGASSSGSVVTVSELFVKRDPPKIGGSVGGFVAVVVALIAITVIASTAAVFLIKEEHEDVESGNRYSQSPPTASTAGYVSTSGAPRPSWFSRLWNLFNSSKESVRAVPSRMKGGRVSGQGWIQAGSGDDWDPHITSQRQSLAPTGGSSIIKPISTQSSRLTEACSSPAKSMATSQGESGSVRFDLRGLSYRESFAPSPQPTVTGLHPPLSPISSGSASPVPLVRSPSPEPISSSPSLAIHSPHTADRQSTNSTQTGHTFHTVRTFEGGTKFIEAL